MNIIDVRISVNNSLDEKIREYGIRKLARKIRCSPGLISGMVNGKLVVSRTRFGQLKNAVKPKKEWY